MTRFQQWTEDQPWAKTIIMIGCWAFVAVGLYFMLVTAISLIKGGTVPDSEFRETTMQYLDKVIAFTMIGAGAGVLKRAATKASVIEANAKVAA